MNAAMKIRWWVIFNALLAGLMVAVSKDAFVFLNHADATKISFITLGVFGIITSFIGYLTLANGYDGRDIAQDKRYINACWFASEMLMGLGLIGTVIGIILMFSGTVGGLDPGNVNAMKAAILSMASGLTTAFVTTLVGITTSLLVKLQLINYEVNQADDE
jgi:hypothetical protein